MTVYMHSFVRYAIVGHVTLQMHHDSEFVALGNWMTLYTEFVTFDDSINALLSHVHYSSVHSIANAPMTQCSWDWMTLFIQSS